jgi:hypothetical protein
VETIRTNFIRTGARVVQASLAALFLTAVHHVYGAYVYGTPWRTHVAFVSVVAAAALVGSFAVLRRPPGTVAGEIALSILAVVTLAIPVVGIGLFEGAYNHALKNALYFGGASLQTLSRLFPPPAYELPNDVFFEVTGVLQLFLGVAAGRRLYQLLAARRRIRRVSASAETA